jgi:hypothetical protein
MSTPIILHLSGNDYSVSYPDHLLRFEVLNIREDSRGIHGELTVTSENDGLAGDLLWEHLTLSSGPSRKNASNRLKERWPAGPNFEVLLHEVCWGVVNKWRTGEPFVQLAPQRRQTARYRLNPLLPDGQITVLFGDGGTGKGFLALGASVDLTSPVALLGMGALPAKTIWYLDWETDEEEIADRLARVCEGAMVETPPNLIYRRCFAALADDISSILRMATQHPPDVVIADSMGLAVGGNPNDSGDTIRAMRALRMLRCTVLALDHSGKGEAAGKSMGNSYKYHYARSVWELRRGESNQDDLIEVGLFHHKANNGRRLTAPLGFRLSFEGDDGPVTIDHGVRVSDIEGLKERLSVGRRILDALDKSRLTRDELKDQLDDVKEEAFKKAILRLTQRAYVTLDRDGRFGKPVR